MSDEERNDPKKNVELLRATAFVTELLVPFSPEDQTKIMVGALTMTGADKWIISGMAVRDLMKKVRPGGG
jgi:hypothetical protein